MAVPHSPASPRRVHLRPTMQGDPGLVLSLERDPDTVPFIAGTALEAELREAVKVEGGFESLPVMAMLASEFAQRRTAGGELRP